MPQNHSNPRDPPRKTGTSEPTPRYYQIRDPLLPLPQLYPSVYSRPNLSVEEQQRSADLLAEFFFNHPDLNLLSRSAEKVFSVNIYL